MESKIQIPTHFLILKYFHHKVNVVLFPMITSLNLISNCLWSTLTKKYTSVYLVGKNSILTSLFFTLSLTQKHLMLACLEFLVEELLSFFSTSMVLWLSWWNMFSTIKHPCAPMSINNHMLKDKKLLNLTNSD